jgi:metallo-beta-lactamase family protein
MSATLGFYGGVGSVTGANFLLDTGSLAILVDCGLVQGDRFAQEDNSEPFAYNPADIDVLIVTHAHADHIGRIPKLVRDGFKGVIYSTPPTRDLAEIMLADAQKVMEYEKEKFGTKVLYDAKDIAEALRLWEVVPYKKTVELTEGVSFYYTDAGHILGSGMVHLMRNGKKIVFTGDIGNVPQPLLNPPEVPDEYTYMIMESVYGDRVHEEVSERTDMLLRHIQETQKTGGTLIIPAFSLERTQGMLLEINNLVESKLLAPISVYLDSPLAIAVTDVYRRYSQYLSDSVQEQIQSGDDIFSFEGLSYTKTVKASEDIKSDTGAKVIIAGSGMSHGGRIRKHELNYLDERNTTVLLVGYQSVGSLGRLLQDGAKKVRIDDVWVKVRAKIATIRGYSGHADRDQLVSLVAKGGEKAQQVFVTMGEEHSSLFLVQRLREYLGVNAIAPSAGQEIEVDF